MSTHITTSNFTIYDDQVHGFIVTHNGPSRTSTWLAASRLTRELVGGFDYEIWSRLVKQAVVNEYGDGTTEYRFGFLR